LQGLTKNKIIPTSTDRGVAFLNFKTNKLLFTIDGPWAIKELNESHVHYGISTLPLFKNKISRPFVGVQGFMIRRSSKEKLLAKEFIEKYLMGKTSMENFYKFDNRLPARMDVLDLLALSNEQVKVLKESVASGIPMPNIPQMGSVWGAMGKAFSLSLEQGLDPKKSLDQVIGQVQ
jgi:maltose/maltodextrin transport system substrate-binding protein